MLDIFELIKSVLKKLLIFQIAEYNRTFAVIDNVKNIRLGQNPVDGDEYSVTAKRCDVCGYPFL